MNLAKPNIEFLGTEIGNGKIQLQPHISKKILEMPNKLEELKQLQQFLGLVNYAGPFIKDLGKIIGPLYNKASTRGQRSFNQEDVNIILQIKEIVKKLPDLSLPLKEDYLIIQSDGCLNGWGAILLRKRSKYSPKEEEEICRYASGKYKEQGNLSTIDQEILAVCYALDVFRLYILNKSEFTLRTDCEAIVKFIHNKDSKRCNNRRWHNFSDRILNHGYKIIFEHIKGSNNQAADILSRLIYDADAKASDKAYS